MANTPTTIEGWLDWIQREPIGCRAELFLHCGLNLPLRHTLLAHATDLIEESWDYAIIGLFRGLALTFPSYEYVFKRRYGDLLERFKHSLASWWEEYLYEDEEEEVNKTSLDGLAELIQGWSFLIKGAPEDWQPTEAEQALLPLLPLKKLVLPCSALKQLPAYVHHLPSITRLELGHPPSPYSISEWDIVPEEEGKESLELPIRSRVKPFSTTPELTSLLALFPKLRILKIVGCGIQQVPDTIGSLSELQELNLSFNLLTELPETIGQCKKLSTLNVQGNLLEGLPQPLQQLPQLQHINLCSNALKTFPALPSSFLETLNLSDNQLNTLPQRLHYPRLQKIYLTHNALTSLPNSLWQLPALHTLHLDHNALKTVRLESASALPICEMSLKNNPLVALEGDWSGLVKLVRLYCQNTNLYRFDASLATLPQALCCYFHNTPLEPYFGKIFYTHPTRWLDFFEDKM